MTTNLGTARKGMEQKNEHKANTERNGHDQIKNRPFLAQSTRFKPKKIGQKRLSYVAQTKSSHAVWRNGRRLKKFFRFRPPETK